MLLLLVPLLLSGGFAKPSRSRFPRSDSSSFELNIYHTNDIHARFDERGATDGGSCRESPCYGGMPRHATFFKNYVDSSANNLILSAGDWFTGTTYFSVFRGNLSAHYLNMFQYDAWAFGNHEFDIGPEKLTEAVQKLNYTIPVVANIEIKAPLSDDLTVEKYTVKELSGRKVGIIGYVLPETKYLSNPGDNIDFSAVLGAVRTAAEELRDAGVNIIIALGHAGIDTDIEICQEIPEVDVVVGGHTNTFLYNGEYPEGATIKEPRYGSYPLTYRNGACLVVQDYAYGKYMGNLSVSFNSDGEVTSYSGNPVLLWGEEVPQDPAVLAELQGFIEQVENFTSTQVGYTARAINGSRPVCRNGECELGNIVADAYLWDYRQNDKTAVCAFTSSGSLRASIDAGNITYKDLLEVLPYGNTVDRAVLSGAMLREALEWGVVNFTTADGNDEGRYLQVAGLKVTYDISQPKGSRVSKVEIQDENGDYKEMEDEAEYNCVSTSYQLGGGDGFSMLKEAESVSGRDDVSVLVDWVKANSPVDEYEGIADLPQRSFFSESASLVPYWTLISLAIALITN